MSIFIRRAFSIGPFRINLSKSGFGVSLGVKGLRIGQRPDGKRYLHAGRGGLYFRQSLDTASPAPETDEQIESARNSILFGLVLVVLGFALVVAIVVFFAAGPRLGSPASARPARAGVVRFPTFAPTGAADTGAMSDDEPEPAPVASVKKDGAREWTMPGGAGSIKAGKKRTPAPTVTP